MEHTEVTCAERRAMMKKRRRRSGRTPFLRATEEGRIMREPNALEEEGKRRDREIERGEGEKNDAVTRGEKALVQACLVS